MFASAILVSNTISEIMERMSSLSIFGEKMKKHLTVLKEKCSDPSKLNLKDTYTGEWLGKVSTAVKELFYLVDDLFAETFLLQNQSKIASLFSACKPTLPLPPQLKEIEEQLSQLTSDSSLNKIKMSTNENANSNSEEEMLEEDLKKLGLDSWRLSQCFAYCSVIYSPTCLIMKTETLIRLWMAEGFMGPVLQSSSSSSQPEDIALDCIEEFIRKEIFFKFEDGWIYFYSSKAELAKRAAGKENLYVEDHNVEEVSKEDVRKRVQRVVLDSELDVSNGIPKPLFEKVQVKQMRTFFLSMQSSRVPHQVKLNWSARDQIFSKFTRLRVLTLTDLGMERLPPSIGGLKSLRYLDLSHNNMNKLPNSIGELKYLQTLMLAHCHRLRKLPDGANHFPSLRHLVLDQCFNLKHMPSVLSKLTWLRTLSLFVVSNRKGLEGLLPLNNLREKLEISQLEQFKLKKQSKYPCFYIKDKQHLQCLTLRWNHENYCYYDQCFADKEEEQTQVLSQLEPHPNLKILSIIGYKGNRFPDWLPSLTNLVEISLYYCSNCQSLPSFHLIPTLTKLTLMCLDSLQFVTNGDNGIMEEGLKLQEVKISDCPNLIGWWKEEEGTQNNEVFVFTSISELVLEYCPNLLHMPLFPDLDKKLVLDSSNLKPLLNTLTHKYTGSNSSPPLSKLTEMTIINVDREQYPPPNQKLLKNFTSLEQLKIMHCQGLKSITGWNYLDQLDQLHISNCTEIDLPEDEWKGLQCLRKLVIENITDLQNLPEGIKHLTSLNSLHIMSCPKLKTLPQGIQDLPRHQFQFLILEDCPVLESLHLEGDNLVRKIITNCPLLVERQSSQVKETFTPFNFVF